MEVKAGTRFTRDLFDKVWNYHNEWTTEFFAELDRRGDPGRFDRSKAPVIMELLKRQLLSPRYIQHSARVLFVVGQADKQERAADSGSAFRPYARANRRSRSSRHDEAGCARRLRLHLRHFPGRRSKDRSFREPALSEIPARSLARSTSAASGRAKTMCGICGIIGVESREKAEAVARRMLAAILHRGPDEEGLLLAPPLAAGMRRLSIIDLAGGRQPIYNEDGTLGVVFNGEIYNFRELRASSKRAATAFAPTPIPK